MVTAKKQIKEAKKILRQIMSDQLAPIAYNMVDYVMKRARRATPADLINATKDIPIVGVSAYKNVLIDSLASISMDAINLAKSEIPGAKKVKLSDYDQLPPNLKRKVKTQVGIIAESQMHDIELTVRTTYMHNYATTDSMNAIERELLDMVDEYIFGSSVESSSFVATSTTVSASRDEVFDDKEINELLDALMFVNGDPVTPICTELAGTVFDVDDPMRFILTPPLHWGCQSYIQPIPKGKLGDREIERLRPSKTAMKSVKFEEQFAYALIKNSQLSSNQIDEKDLVWGRTKELVRKYYLTLE